MIKTHQQTNIKFTTYDTEKYTQLLEKQAKEITDMVDEHFNNLQKLRDNHANELSNYKNNHDDAIHEDNRDDETICKLDAPTDQLENRISFADAFKEAKSSFSGMDTWTDKDGKFNRKGNLHLSQDEMALKLGITKADMTQLMNGRKIPDRELYDRFFQECALIDTTKWTHIVNGDPVPFVRKKINHYNYDSIRLPIAKNSFVSRLRKIVGNINIDEKIKQRTKYTNDITITADIVNSWLEGEKVPSLNQLVELTKLIGNSVTFLIVRSANN